MKVSVVFTTLVLFSVLAVSCSPFSQGSEDPHAALRGTWVAQSMETDGEAIPDDHAKQLQFTFQDGKVLVRGNYPDDDRVEEFQYRIDPTQTPKHMEIFYDDDEAPILGIYDQKGDRLTFCFTKEGDRPEDFTVIPGSDIVLIVFERQSP